MTATHKDSILRSLVLDAAMVESLPEAVWSELIGFLEYDRQLVRESEGELARDDAFDKHQREVFTASTSQPLPN